MMSNAQVDAVPNDLSVQSARSSVTRSWALRYAAIGWRVYPIERGGKRPLFSGWLADATTDPGLITRWWPRDKGAPNIGVIAGELFDVIDIEAEHLAGFRDAARARGLSVTPLARSGGGGLHLYIASLGLGTRRLVWKSRIEIGGTGRSTLR